MTLTELKIYAMSQAAEMNLPSLARQDMLNKIKNADEYQTMGFVLDQKFYNFNDKGKIAIKERFINTMTPEETKRVNDKINKRLLQRTKNVKLQNCHKRCRDLANKLKSAEDEKKKHKYILGIKRNTEKYDNEISRLYQLVIKCQKQCDNKFDKK
jgi:hypothetical protein